MKRQQEEPRNNGTQKMKQEPPKKKNSHTLRKKPRCKNENVEIAKVF